MTITPSNATILFGRVRAHTDIVLVEGALVAVVATALYAAAADHIVAGALRLIVW